ncbi:MAG: hypothetical protein LC700_00920, partial [Actinobacteria bacterium]|nr:hypothetical protein [Actinomycetota bacterium]
MDPDIGNRHHRQLTNGQDTWRARCQEIGTPGSGGGSGRRTGGNTGTAPGVYLTTQPSTLDMLTALRRQIIATRFLPPTPRPATTQEILEVQQAWALA